MITRFIKRGTKLLIHSEPSTEQDGGLGMDKQFRLTFYWTYDHLAMPGFKLSNISFCCRYITISVKMLCKWPSAFINSFNPYIPWYLHCITPESVKDIGKHTRLPKRFTTYTRADSRFAPGQWETSLQSNAISHWLGANLDSALYTKNVHHPGDIPYIHDDVIPWKRVPSYWLFLGGIHQSPTDSPHKGPVTEA